MKSKEPIAILAVMFVDRPTQATVEAVRARVRSMESVPAIEDVLVMTATDEQEGFDKIAAWKALRQVLRHFTLRQMVRFNEFVGVGKR